MRYVPLGVLGAGAVVVGAAVGWRGLVVYFFFALVAGAFLSAAGVGGPLLQHVSRRRFEERP